METISFQDLVDLLPSGGLEGRPTEHFKVADRRSVFIEPTLRPIDVNENFEFLLISARGATGKSALAEKISNDCNVPLWNLGEKDAPAVSGDAFASRLGDYLGHSNPMERYLEAPGSYVLIDAMDEGRIRVSGVSWQEFTRSLTNSASIDHPVILLGRERILEDLWVEFSTAGKTVTWYEISHFDPVQRVSYVDAGVSGDLDIENPAYIAARENVLAALAGSVESELAESFVGYAPVLDAVVALLRRGNLAKIENEFAANGNVEPHVEVLRDILWKLLEREQSDKVRPMVERLGLPTGDAHAPAEQVRWLASDLLGSDQPSLEWCPVEQRNDYYDHLRPILDDHPFLSASGSDWASPVFSSFVVSELFDDTKIRASLGPVARRSGLLYAFLARDEQKRIIDEWQFAALHSSLLASELKSIEAVVELNAGDPGQADGLNADSAEGEFSLLEEGAPRMTAPFSVIFETSDRFVIHGPAAALSVTVPCEVVIRGEAASTLIGPDCYIRSASLVIEGQNVKIVRRPGNSEDDDDTDVIFEIAHEFRCDGTLTPNPPREALSIRVDQSMRLTYPWVTYKADLPPVDASPNDRAQRFLNMLMNLARAHGHKDGFAVFDKKLEGRQSIKDTEFRTVVDYMQSKGMIELRGPMIFLSPEASKRRFSGKTGAGRKTLADREVMEYWRPILIGIASILNS